MPSPTTDKTCLPLSKLSYGTQQRLIDLAPLPELINFQLTGRQAYRLGSRRAKPLYFDTLHITNSVEWAKFRIWLHRFFSVFLAPLEVFSYFLDGPYNTYPYWYHCISGEQVLSQKQHIYVGKTLLMDFRTAQEYDKAVPLIHGSYQQLVLHSKYHWRHIKQLMHAGVKQLQLNGSCYANGHEQISNNEHVEMVPFIMDRAKDHEFNLVLSQCQSAFKLKDLLVPAFENHATHVVKNEHRLMFWKKNRFSCHVAYDWRFPLNWLRPILWTVVTILYVICVFICYDFLSETFFFEMYGWLRFLDFNLLVKLSIAWWTFFSDLPDTCF